MSAPGLPDAMRAQKVWRRCGTALQDNGFAVLDARTTGTGHLAVTIEKEGRRGRVVLPTTPHSEDNTVRITLQIARRTTRAPAR